MDGTVLLGADVHWDSEAGSSDGAVTVVGTLEWCTWDNGAQRQCSRAFMAPIGSVSPLAALAINTTGGAGNNHA
ncbi:MAG: hypothetical protein R2932_42460 [Caldilineaceae bacterium]